MTKEVGSDRGEPACTVYCAPPQPSATRFLCYASQEARALLDVLHLQGVAWGEGGGEAGEMGRSGRIKHDAMLIILSKMNVIENAPIL